MAVFTVLYPATAGARFDEAYYTGTHIPMVKDAYTSTGLTDVQVLKGVAGADGGPPPYLMLVTLTFPDLETLQTSLAGPRSAEVMADVANFTDIQPVAQISVEA